MARAKQTDPEPEFFVDRNCGSFTAGLAAAGMRSPKRVWSDEAIAGAVNAFREEHGRDPRTTDWGRAIDSTPSAATIFKRFGRWAAVLALADRAPPPV